MRSVAVSVLARLYSALPQSNTRVSYMTFHVDNDEFAWSIDAEFFADWKSLASSTREKYSALAEAGVTLDTLQVVVLGPDAGVMSGLGRVSALAVDGQQIHMRIAITFVVARRSGQWQLIHGHSSHALSEPPD
ncbi:MAG: nuclear transport factor 2 family protein [Gemmatimonadota bacterium]|nr:MAG: nuclear transport factor 2 family protein [Gemmatimonadota bacterium]